MRLEYHAANKQWHVKPTAYKGTNSAWAFCYVPDKCLPEECRVGEWKVIDGTKWETQPAITIKVTNNK